MQILIIQIIATVFALFAVSRVYLRFKERKLSSFSFVFWNFVWIAGIVAVFFPNLTTDFARMIGVGRGVDAVIYASLAVISYSIFRIYIKIEDVEREITEVSRKYALKDIFDKRKKTSK